MLVKKIAIIEKIKLYLLSFIIIRNLDVLIISPIKIFIIIMKSQSDFFIII